MRTALFLGSGLGIFFLFFSIPRHPRYETSLRSATQIPPIEIPNLPTIYVALFWSSYDGYCYYFIPLSNICPSSSLLRIQVPEMLFHSLPDPQNREQSLAWGRGTLTAYCLWNGWVSRWVNGCLVCLRVLRQGSPDLSDCFR